jgi:hypothetical protein
VSPRLHALVLAIAFAVGPATAVAVAQPKADKPVAPVVVPAIPIPEIADRFESVTAFLRTLDGLLAPRSDVQSVEQGLPALRKRIDERVEATERALAAAPSLTALDSLADSWQPLRLELSAALGTLRARALTLEEAREKPRTWDGSDLIVPNSAFIAERVTNRTPTSHRVAISIPVRVAYGPAPDKATSAAQSAQVRSDLAIAVYAAPRNAGMEIPLPQQTVRVEVPGPGSVRQRGE